jgi:threonyl-tRNA synthetase
MSDVSNVAPSGQSTGAEAVEQELLESVVGSAPTLSPLETLRHSTAHVMAKAVQRLFPQTKVTIGPSIETGFFYDFDIDRPFTDDDLALIEAEMQKIVDAKEPFERKEVSREEALQRFRDLGETYKVEIIDALPADATISYYQTGDWIDLCRGPHIRNTGEIKAFKLLSVAGAYWRGNEKNRMLQRIYGTAFPSKDELKAFLHRIEEAKKRDHRRLGKDLDLFSIDETIGGGLVLWHPKGARIRYMIEEFWRQEHVAQGYDLVSTPHVARDELWKTSGHLEFYKENMYQGMKVDEQTYLVKPMNCPFHCTIYKKGLHSYKQLPFRWAELGTVYRYERSGVLHGLLRVRGFTQDDAHLFMTREQLAGELHRVVEFCLYILRTFGFTDFKLYLATRPAKFVGDPEIWAEAEKALLEVLQKSGLPYEVDPGGGAFYGPKIDLKLLDAIGREWQCSTVQPTSTCPSASISTTSAATARSTASSCCTARCSARWSASSRCSPSTTPARSRPGWPRSRPRSSASPRSRSRGPPRSTRSSRPRASGSSSTPRTTSWAPRSARRSWRRSRSCWSSATRRSRPRASPPAPAKVRSSR